MRKGMQGYGTLIVASCCIMLCVSGLATSRHRQNTVQEVARDFALTVIASGEVRGKLEPCGCTPGQRGGLGRRHAFIKKRQQEQLPVLLVDNGDLVGQFDRQGEIKFEIGICAMNATGYAAYNIGELDLMFGLSYLNQIKESAQFPFLSANVLGGDGKPVFKPYFVAKVPLKAESTLHVAVVGVLSREFSREVEASGDGLIVEAPENALAQLIPELANSAEFGVLLAHASPDEAARLAGQFPFFRCVVCGHGPDEPGEAVTVGKCIVLGTGANGKFVNVCALSAETSRSRAVPLGQEFSETAEMKELLSAYKAMLKAEGLVEKHRKRPMPRGMAFTGNEPCKPCHPKEVMFWTTTKHAKAYQTLVSKGYEGDPECVICHSIGFDFIGGFSGLAKTAYLRDNGCESCHGPGSKHVADAKAGKGKWPEGKTDKRVCLDCHNHDHSPGFDAQSYLDKTDCRQAKLVCR